VSALQDLAAYLRQHYPADDMRLLELLGAAKHEQLSGTLPDTGHVGDDLDIPFVDRPGGYLELQDCVLAGGVIVQAAAVPVPEVGRQPALVLRFSRYDGHLLRPVVLITDDDQMSKLPPLVHNAAHTARREARS
jgi:hypothetical protein